MATSQADLDAVLTSLGTLVTNEDAVLTQLMTLIASIITKVGGAVDLTNEKVALQSMMATITTEQTNANTAITNLKAAGA